uniref:Transmembrane protein n=1 Tax=Loa loa TaxID=7209 RepID=A0A1I7VTU6_LOALO
MTAQEESLTGDVNLESSIKQKSALSSSINVPSPQISSPTNRSTSERQNIWEHRLDIRAPEQNLEQKKYWEYRNVYHIPVPQGIEYWEDEDKKRWEMINIGGLNESEANRQIKRAIVNNAQIQAGLVFLLLALIPLVGAAADLGLCTAIYNVASAAGVIVATINVYSFKVYQPYDDLNAFIPVAGIVALVQVNF